MDKQAMPEEKENGSANGATFRRFIQNLSVAKVILYTILILYAFLSLLPLFYMTSASLMTLGEVNAGRVFPRGVNISPCILVTTDEFIDRDGQQVTKTRVVISIPEEAAARQGGIAGRATARERAISRDEHFRIPFITNYCAAWQDGNLGRYIWNTIRIVAITVAGTLTLCIPAAYAFARMNFMGRDLLFALMLATLMIPDIVTDLPNFLIVTRIGEFFGREGLGLCEARNCWTNNWPALTIPFMAHAIAIFLMRQHFATIPYELWDAARIDGAGHFRFLLQVVVPLSKPVIAVVILFTFIGAWNALAWPLLVTNDDTWRPISVGLLFFLQTEGNLAHLRMAGVMIALLPVLLLYAVTQRQFIEGLSTSGLKG